MWRMRGNNSEQILVSGELSIKSHLSYFIDLYKLIALMIGIKYFLLQIMKDFHRIFTLQVYSAGCL